jgi:WD40 repeat protein
VLVSIEPGQEKRRLGDDIMTITFGDDGSRVYAVRITEDGTNDIATVLRIDFASGDTTELASIGYARPEVGAEAALLEAQFADEGGLVRLVWTEDDLLHLWALGAGAWEITPDDGEVSEVDDALPTLWSPDGRHRIALDWNDGTTIVNMVDDDAETVASTTAAGLVSHIRWSPDGDRIVFTLGRSAAGGGVLQDLFLWDLGDGEAPMQLTSTGAAFGAEWLGSQPLWRP